MGLDKKNDPSQKYYDRMMTQKFNMLISEQDLAEIEK